MEIQIQMQVRERIDYSHLRSNTTELKGAVVHSGDIIDQEKRMGTHTLTIHLNGLGSLVTEMVITMSSWAGANLADIINPCIEVRLLTRRGTPSRSH
jgi:hypothetical protein